MNQLPKLADLHFDVEAAFKNDELNLLLNQEPPAGWLKDHPIYKNKYLPIDKVEFLLARIFQRVRFEVKDVKQIFNAVVVTCRLHYVNPLNNEWEFQDGVGAAPVQVDAGKDASDLSAIKHNALMIATPAAATAAKKDAADHIGKLFGRDLNRKNTVEFVGAFTPVSVQETSKEPQQVTQQMIADKNTSSSFNFNDL